MAKAIRYIAVVVLFAGLMGAFISMFAEPFTSELYRQLGIDTSKWVGPVLTFFASGAAWSLSMLMLGASVGVFAHWLAMRFDTRGTDAAASPGPTKTTVTLGTEWAKGLTDISVQDAACALAGITPDSFPLSHRAQGIASDLLQRVRDGRLLTSENKRSVAAKGGYILHRSGYNFAATPSANMTTMIDTHNLKHIYVGARTDLDTTWLS